MEDHNTHVAAAMANPLLSDEPLRAAVLHSAELLQNNLELIAVEDFENQIALAAVISFQDEGKGEGKTILFWRKKLAIMGQIVKYRSIGVRKLKFAEKQNITNFAGVLEPMVIVGEDSLAVAPAQIVKILAYTLGE
jgi:hypothetical protein